MRPRFSANAGRFHLAHSIITKVGGFATDGIAGKRDTRTFLSYVQHLRYAMGTST